MLHGAVLPNEVRMRSGNDAASGTFVPQGGAPASWGEKSREKKAPPTDIARNGNAWGGRTGEIGDKYMCPDPVRPPEGACAAPPGER